jgi:23S rRNA pseudouridine1911/1915/1917 synthase
VKHPILGDPLYGTNFEIATKYLDKELSLEDRIKYTGAKRLLLHAFELDFKYDDIRYIIRSQSDFFNLEKLIK